MPSKVIDRVEVLSNAGRGSKAEGEVTLDHNSLLSKWRSRNGKPKPKPLTELRPAAKASASEPEQRGLRCQACGGLTEDIQCIQGDYWVCPACKRRHTDLADYAQRCTEFRKAELGDQA